MLPAVARKRLAIALTVTSTLLSIGAIGWLAPSWSATLPDTWGFRGYAILEAVTYTAVGAVLTIRRPANAIGWLLLLIGVLMAMQSFALEYAIYAIVGAHSTDPSGSLAAWFGSWIWVPVVALIQPSVLLLFPDGRLPSAKWRPAIWILALSAISTAAIMAFRPGPLEGAAFQANPFPLLPKGLVLPLNVVALGAGFPAAAAVAWSVVRRFNRATGSQRQQIKWLAVAALPTVVVGFASAVLDDKSVQVLAVLGQALIPVTIGVAILRYRLYDVDVLINRALVYGATTAGIAIAFFAGIVVLQALLRPLTGGSELAVAASTLVSFALFQPLKSRIEDAVDRRFYRSRYDAVRTLDAFSVRLRDEVDLDAVRADLLDAVRETVQPAHASVWLR